MANRSASIVQPAHGAVLLVLTRRLCVFLVLRDGGVTALVLVLLNPVEHVGLASMDAAHGEKARNHASVVTEAATMQLQAHLLKMIAILVLLVPF